MVERSITKGKEKVREERKLTIVKSQFIESLNKSQESIIFRMKMEKMERQQMQVNIIIKGKPGKDIYRLESGVALFPSS